MRRFLRPIPLALGAAALLLLYTLTGFFVVPHIIKAHVLPAVSDRLQRPVTVKKVQCNPFVLSLKIIEFEITETDGTPLMGFQEFFINFQSSSMFRGAYVFDEIRFVLPFASVRVSQDGHVNFAGLLYSKAGAGGNQDAASVRKETVESSPPAPPADLPAVEIGHFEIAQGIVEYHDASKPSGVSIDVVPINLVLKNFHTRAGGDNTYAFTAELGKDEVLDWKGTVSLQPMASEGTLSLSGVKIATLFQYVKDRFQFDIPTGTIRATGKYRFAAGSPLDLGVSDTVVHLVDVGIVEPGDPRPVIFLKGFFLDGIHADLRERKLEIESVTLHKGNHRIWRNPDGTLNLPGLLMPAVAPEEQRPASASSGRPWTVSVKKADVMKHNIEFEDLTLDFPARVMIGNLSVHTHDVALPFKEPIPLTVEHRLNETGSVSVDGQVVMQPFRAEFALSLKDIAIQPFQPYIERFARIAVDSGSLDLDGTLRFAAEHDREPLLAFRGNVGVKTLAIADGEAGAPVASLKHVQLSQIALTLDPTSVTVEEVGINQPTLHLAIDRDGVANIKKLVPRAQTASAPPPAERPSSHGKAAQPPSIAIKTVRVLRGTATFQDESITPPVQAGLYDLTGTVKGLSSKQMARADVDLSGKVDKVASLKIKGTINPLTEDAFTDLTMRFDNVDLTTAAPYTGKYVGFPIRKGKLFLDLAYKVSEKQLQAENKVAVDQLTFGEKTDSPDATTLPVLFAVALLKDRHGRIDIDLPIRGDLKDPDFRYGKVVWSTLSNLLTKIVASPFSLIGKLVPDGEGEDLQHLTFEPGSSAISPTEMKKIDALAKGLEERPGLRLEITGTADPTRDREAVALQRLQEAVRTRWLQESGHAADGEVPADAEARLIASLFAQWRKQQPDEPQRSGGPPTTTEEMKRKLMDSIRVDDDALRALARSRAEQVHAHIVTDGKLSEERVFLTDVDLTASDQGKVQSRLNITAGS